MDARAEHRRLDETAHSLDEIYRPRPEDRERELAAARRAIALDDEQQ
ncbi:hypothetical protein [Streptomyces platensis]|nr:hypothetical protein [Streptomyces platensis]